MSARPLRDGPPEPPEPPDVEILEVIGLDEDDADAAEAEPDVEVVFEAEREAEAAPPVPAAPPARPDDGAGVERERYLRLYADFENLKKRVERERIEQRGRATEDLVARLLPVLDNFERALAARGGEEAFRSGVQMIHRQLSEELRRDGLRPIDSLGSMFDPEIHEAVATTSDSGQPPHTVVGELQRGYFLGDRLLRPALVRVQTDGGGEAEPAEAGQES